VTGRTGGFYELDLDYYLDDVHPLWRRKGFPHLVKDGNKVQYMSFRADMECGITTVPRFRHWCISGGLTIAAGVGATHWVKLWEP